MTIKNHKIITAVLNIVAIFGSFEALTAILNLNQPELYFKTAFYVGLFFVIQIALLYDLHYKNRGSFKRAVKEHENDAQWVLKHARILSTSFFDRFSHLFEWRFIRKWFAYQILPGVIYWSTIVIIFSNFGFPKIQQIFVLLSGLALFLNYLHLKEIFQRGKEPVDRDVFVVLSMVKIYASTIMYGAGVVLIRRYCLDASYLFLGSFALTFLIVYQALFQHRAINKKNLVVTLLISLAMAQAAYAVLVFWGYNYFTASVLLGAIYNVLWGIFHHTLDKALTKSALLEILMISFIVAGMVFSVTNFRAQILDDCMYTLNY